MTTILHVEMITESPLHISSERGQTSGNRRPFLKTVTGLPYIPGSSLKGCLRHEIERFLRSEQIRVCHAPVAEEMCQSARPCPVCQLFGSPWLESRLFFHDLHLSNAHVFTRGAPSPTMRPSVRLNRRRRVAQEGLYFEKELFEPGYNWIFSGDIVYADQSPDQLPDELVMVFMAAQAVTMMGSARSRGLGWGTVRIQPNVISAETLNDMWQRLLPRLPRQQREGS